MAESPVPGGVERGIVKPSNMPGAAGGRANDGSLPLTRTGGTVKPANYGMGGDRRGGTADLAGQPSPIVPPNHQFVVGMGMRAQSE